MSTVGENERKTQKHVIQIFKEDLGYEYLRNWHHRTDNCNVEEGILRSYLSKQHYNENLITKAIETLEKAASNQSEDLYYANREVYNLLRYGIKIKEEVGTHTQTVWVIDWKNPHNNQFAVAEEVAIGCKRPDIVLYVNGIALGILELKRSTVSVSEGIRQNITNQSKDCIQSFFNTIQLVMAGNNTNGLRYGVIETKERYYLSWKELNTAIDNNTKPLSLEQGLIQICHKERFLELIHDFIVFDAGIKKIGRHNQYYGVKLAQERVHKHEGGIIWHTQGSGKSMTMVWLAKWILENMPDARVLIITDRTELDEQIEKIFKGVNQTIDRCLSGADLLKKLSEATPPYYAP